MYIKYRLSNLFFVIPTIIFLNYTISVSYTHLDVYKRQNVGQDHIDCTVPLKLKISLAIISHSVTEDKCADQGKDGVISYNEGVTIWNGLHLDTDNETSNDYSHITHTNETAEL